MGRKGDGVEIREKSIRLSFVLDGREERKTLKVNGKPMLPTPANVKYAKRVAAEIRDRIRHGTFVMSEYFPSDGVATSLLLGDWLDRWLAAQRIERSTRDGYATAIKFWKETACDETHTKPLGGVSIRSLKAIQIQTAIANRPDLSGKTINNYLSVLRAALALAVTDKFIAENPTEAVPRAKHQKPTPDPFDRDESDRIISEAERAYPGQVHNLTEFWFWTGLRTSEIYGLEWPQIDLASATMLVAKAYVRGEQLDRTKTKVARLVHLNSRAMAALQRQRQFTQMAGGRVFLDPRYNEVWHDEDAFRRTYWEPMLRRLGIRYRRPYNMRHSYATAMLMVGMTPAFCAKQLGHSVEMFLNTYSKWIDGNQNSLEMARLESTLTSRKPPQDKERIS
ncbi:site-specific integrase [Burkholderia multivorans]|uniref:site-specific integrase n=1 Tax=Burkholderia multivorans TaxID=87883 RepID=UPI00075885BB|nr:site-specific integrase [Burkholderia multivorans]KVS11206.1 integrase [Burkholderia multivorans]MBU9254325.1 site-specific integrase [Burkholderia multivorans]MDN8098614.1 tyrosine-type recombinase/integrase [Burkholderia multivorans]